MAEYISKSLEETKIIAQKILDTGARIIALKGDLGAGKTALTKCIAEILGIVETVTSPTYVIMKKYTPPAEYSRSLPLKGEIHNLVHIDAYRLNYGKELEALNFNEIINDSGNLVIIEWPEMVQDILPSKILTIQCDFVDEMTRKYTF